ncbi:sugar O-acetyltransferase, partial [Aliiroseovarius sp. YM-037]|uniref:sugar O-acetyltransferase n=1 Tax=Aliiroseovarius sp. YM-037 TaxID=3341728 RepID=UPI003A7FF6AB
MSLSEREKMKAGAWYSCLDPELEALRVTARAAVHAHNTMHPDDRGEIAAPLRTLFAKVGQGAMIEAPFHCPYGFNISVGDYVYLNAGCTILDTALVTIGAATMLGPNVQIYCADHHRDPAKRAEGLEIAHPVTIGANVWIG